ncbi:MAG: hypothetical protein IT361_16580 [Gemmatimonadaceae bacterium]|nr:hypothetical protein [Gemmatimonadaceae bacterium]
MRFVRLVDALAMTLLFAGSIAGLVNLVTAEPRPSGTGQWSVFWAQLAYVVLGPIILWGWRKRRPWLAPFAWGWGLTLTYTGAAATRFYGGQDLRAVFASLLAGGIIAAVTVFWITRRNVLAPMPPSERG